MIRTAKNWIRGRARSVLLVVGGTLVALQTLAGTVSDLVIGVMLLGLVALASRFG